MHFFHLEEQHISTNEFSRVNRQREPVNRQHEMRKHGEYLMLFLKA